MRPIPSQYNMLLNGYSKLIAQSVVVWPDLPAFMNTLNESSPMFLYKKRLCNYTKETYNQTNSQISIKRLLQNFAISNISSTE
mmetsp:Transcript_44614/g.94942  ORF Transcript_44614/g.94942 Transcript_44614/m.94942 type:complete len:83 (-) Transcript_44614:849-1097(-)